MGTLTTESPSKWDAALGLYEEGAGDIEICKLFKIKEAQFDRMYRDVPAFAAIVDFGRTLSKAWWYETLRKNIRNKDFNTSLFNFAMKNLHGWADKVESVTTVDTTKSADAMRTELIAIMSRLEDKDPSLARQLTSVKST